uniref:Bifunctional inhibitor/plant lipid transfer protein/seed storage helical domain-containing protein n=1 Tax=Setaria viridis TaxID=4556 RepID=A0A4U6VH82_SETVI|nr:hypothetical protein SEVIR_3G211701v2 [Setaria viridis]
MGAMVASLATLLPSPATTMVACNSYLRSSKVIRTDCSKQTSLSFDCIVKDIQKSC